MLLGGAGKPLPCAGVLISAHGDDGFLLVQTVMAVRARWSLLDIAGGRRVSAADVLQTVPKSAKAGMAYGFAVLKRGQTAPNVEQKSVAAQKTMIVSTGEDENVVRCHDASTITEHNKNNDQTHGVFHCICCIG